MTTLDREVAPLEWLTSYVTGSLSLAELEDRTASALFELGGATTGPLAEQLQAIELHLAEYTNGHVDESELRRLLARMTHYLRVELVLDGDASVRLRTGTSSVTVGEADESSLSGTGFAAAFA